MSSHIGDTSSKFSMTTWIFVAAHVDCSRCMHTVKLRSPRQRMRKLGYAVQVGQRVVIAFDIACGTCGACQREEFSGCETTNDSKLTQSMYGHCPCAIFGYRCAPV